MLLEAVNRDHRQPHRTASGPAVDARPTPTPQQQEELERYFRETPEGRAQFLRFLEESPQVRAELIEFFRDDPDGRAKAAVYLATTAEGRAELDEYFRSTEGSATMQEHLRAIPEGEALLRGWIAEETRLEQPMFLEAVRVDAGVYESLMMKPPRFLTGLRLMREALKLAWTHDTFFCQLLYRLRVRLFLRGVPVLPKVLHRLCVILHQLDIGDYVVIEPGVYMPHGKVVMDGMVHVGRGTIITPWVTLGLTTTIEGPTIGRDVMIGTGAKILGPVTVGDGARIAANAVVIHDVPPCTTVAGAPARVVRVHDES